jgi:hypothetical protein
VLFFLEIFSAASTPCTPPPANFSVDIRACHRIIGFCSGNGKHSLAFWNIWSLWWKCIRCRIHQTSTLAHSLFCSDLCRLWLGSSFFYLSSTMINCLRFLFWLLYGYVSYSRWSGNVFMEVLLEFLLLITPLPMWSIYSFREVIVSSKLLLGMVGVGSGSFVIQGHPNEKNLSSFSWKEYCNGGLGDQLITTIWQCLRPNSDFCCVLEARANNTKSRCPMAIFP